MSSIGKRTIPFTALLLFIAACSIGKPDNLTQRANLSPPCRTNPGATHNHSTPHPGANHNPQRGSLAY